MTTTELSIVYQLLNVIRASELNSDEVVDERQVRSFLRAYRPSLIAKYSISGIQIQEVCFQDVNVPDPNRTSFFQEYDIAIPQIVQLPNFMGVKLRSASFYNIPVTNEEDYYLSKENPINKYQPKATIDHKTLKIFSGRLNPNIQHGSDAMQSIITQIGSKEIKFRAVLDDPSDAISYDWTKDQYPFPSEIIPELKATILKREFQIILETKSDQVSNMKNDTLRYHDQGKVNQ